ncbi:hypothetical protein BCR34DRAFT_663595 [Clohesyomyces aquaticus]|uniref:Uncharacterized protein n=1 Tax=Clohesyomyces aquaticus TaxID=1231657 RepID=A0A1Y1ZRL7_9PLEO|nr:hypothetical protein BCR34DRAFT_663595 [Clohesyomyces aquaticus]
MSRNSIKTVKKDRDEAQRRSNTTRTEHDVHEKHEQLQEISFFEARRRFGSDANHHISHRERETSIKDWQGKVAEAEQTREATKQDKDDLATRIHVENQALLAADMARTSHQQEEEEPEMSSSSSSDETLMNGRLNEA